MSKTVKGHTFSFILTIVLISTFVWTQDLEGINEPEHQTSTETFFLSQENLVQNPGFEDGMSNWTEGIYPPGSDGEIDIPSGGYSGDCLKMQHGNSTWQACSQTVGKLEPGKVYLLSVMFNTTFTHYGYINLHDRSWNRPDGGTGKSFTAVLQGKDEWMKMEKRVRTPLFDDIGNSTSDDSWTVILYSHYPYENEDPVFYDNISLIEEDTSNIPTGYLDIEELFNWNGHCQRYSNDYPLAPWNPDMIDQGISNGVPGEFALVITGNRTIENSYSITLPVKPDSKYRFSARIRVENRTAYNYLDLDYPDWLIATQEGIHTTVMATRGIWCGLYSLNLRDTDDDDINVLTPEAIDHPYISHSDIDWFREEYDILTSNGSCEITITINIKGFEGSLWIDELALEEVPSFIDDSYLHIPINTEFQGMRIEEFSSDPLYVSTNAARYYFENDHISLVKDGIGVGELRFLETDFLEGLAPKRESGLVILENNNIILSIGADSSAIFKLKRTVEVTIGGPKPEYHSYEAGIIFSTDHSRGILFSPIYPSSILKGMPYVHDKRYDYKYFDQQFEEAGLKNWNMISDFSGSEWKISYTFQEGDGFLTSIFPPKEFNQTKLHKEKVASAGIDLNTYPDADYSYFVQKFRERNNIMLLWMNGYAVSSNDQDHPEFYYLDQNNIPVTPDHPEARAFPFTPIDVAGPYNVEEEDALHRLVEEAHRQDVKVIVYMSPRFYHTSDIDIFLENLENNIKEFDLDGVYYDGYYEADPLRNLELVRRTRDILGDKFYCQHNSWTDTVIRRSDHFRVPFYEAYADRLWVGEAVKKVDDDTFRLNYCGMNVSNTPSTLLSEFRPVDYSLPKEESLALAIPVQDQMDMQLKYSGEYRLPPFGYLGTILDRRYQTTGYFDSSYYRDREYSIGRRITSGDGEVDVCEDIYTSPADCSPLTERAFLKNDGNTFTCETDLSVAQWIVDGEPLFDLHFTFDGLIATDDSDHRLNPSQNIGYHDNEKAPFPRQMDGRGVFEFGDGRKLYSICDGSLDYSDRSFSSFGVIKRNDSSDSKQVIFSLNDDENIYFGIEDSRFTVYPRDGDLEYGTEEISPNGYQGNCVRMQHNDATWQATYQRVGDLVPGKNYNFSVMFKTAPSHKAYVNLYTSDWKDREGKIVGKSYIPALMPGNNEWSHLFLNQSIPETMDNGESSSECEWSVILYSHSPVDDNSPIFYDDISLWDGSRDLVTNGDFENGFGSWIHYSYIPEEKISGNTEIETGQWYTLGIVYDRPLLSLYVNGIKEIQININITGFPKYGNYTIGAYDRLDRSRTFKGYIDDLFIGSLALTPEQVRQYHETMLKVLTMECDDIRCIVTDDGDFLTANRFPTIDRPGNIDVNEDELFQLDITAKDPDENELSWEVDTNAAWIDINKTAPSLTGIPENKDVGAWWVNITVMDMNGGYDQYNLTINVMNMNDPPVIDPLDIGLAYEDVYFEILLRATDVDPTEDELLWGISTDNTFLRIDRISGLLFGTPTSNDIGVHWANVTVSDGKGGTDSYNFTFRVIGTNDAPVLSSPPAELVINEDEQYGIDLLEWFHDPDEDQLDFIIDPSQNIKVDLLNGSIVVIRPAPDWSGTENIRFTANDTTLSVSHTLLVIVLQVNDPPAGALIHFENWTYFENSDQPAIGTATDPDLEYGDLLTYRWYSSISGELDSGRKIDLSLPSGHHNITLKVVDSEGSWTSTWARIEILDDPNTMDDDTLNDDDQIEEDKTGPWRDKNWLIIAIIVLSILIMTYISIRVIKQRSEYADHEE